MKDDKAKPLDEHNPGSALLSMVEWYAPDQLLSTVKEVIVSSLFSHHADRRAFYTEWQNPHLKPFAVDFHRPSSANQGQAKRLTNINIEAQTAEINSPDEAIWIDYVADTGDGGNSTYTVANLLLNDTDVSYKESTNLGISKTEFDNIKTACGGKIPRADLHILGGDLVYPIASEEHYKKFFITHFNAALPQKTQDNLPITEKSDLNSVVFAFPQNHDWYDSLASFSTLFCHKEKDIFLDMFCPQEQSYAAIKLPYDWWLFGLDFGLTDDIDDLQFEYFRRIIEGKIENGTKVGGLTPQSKVIVQYPSPYWALAALDVPKTLSSYRYEDLEKLIEKATGKDISIRLAGDQHHYRRYSTANNNGHLITCGTGGAFLHPTHGPVSMNNIHHERDLSGEKTARKFTHDCDNKNYDCLHYKSSDQLNYPPPETSFKLSLGNLNGFFLRNILFGLFDLFNMDISLISSQIKGKSIKETVGYLWDQYRCRFGLITAITYFMVVWLNFVCLHTNLKSANINSIFFEKEGMPLSVTDLDFDKVLQAFETWCWAFLMSPLSMLIILGMIANFGIFAQKFNPHKPTLSLCFGLVHGIVHFLMIFLCYWIVIYGINLLEPLDPIWGEIKLSRFVIIGICVALLGDIVGTFTMAWYLFITVNLHRWLTDVPLLHFNEAFSSLSVQDYKGILRMRISKDKLEAFFIGVDKVPRKWKKNDGNDLSKPTWEAVDQEIKPVLVDYWSVKN
jgi:hypothetical protein